jgi:NADP-dependent 3-hydroxy acid dehydrogenase YdfG
LLVHQDDSSTIGSAPTPVTSDKVWFIAGASRVLVADLKEEHGANVLTLEFDVTNPDQVKTAVAQAHAHFGRLDIVLNNAGYSLIGRSL